MVTRSHGGGRPQGRNLTVKLRTAKGRKASSVRWLSRQLNDPYVTEAHRRGYRSRAAFKLIQLNERFHFLSPGKRVVDLGAAPGGWTQVAVDLVRATGRAGQGQSRGRAGMVVALDIVEMEAVAGAAVLTGDFLAEDTPKALHQALGGAADVVLSDMSPSATGHSSTDHLRIIALCEAALAFAGSVLAPGGTFVAKVFQGGAQAELLAVLKRDFATVRHAKPEASRSESAEMYVVARGFRARRRTPPPESGGAPPGPETDGPETDGPGTGGPSSKG